MIAVDTNILVYAHRGESSFHDRASECLRSLSEGADAWAIAWPCLHEFFAVVTHPRIYDPATPAERAIDQIEAWLESPTLVLLSEAEGYWIALRRLLTNGHVLGPRVHDARIAALCTLHGVGELWTADRDFSRFPNLRAVNPLLG